MNTFAYLIATCARESIIHDEILDDWTHGNSSSILEAHVSVEGQVDEAKAIWSFDWESYMDRVALIQVTKGWDCRAYLIDLFRQCGISPSYQVDAVAAPISAVPPPKQVDPVTGELIGHIIYYEKIPTLQSLSGAMEAIHVTVPNPKDRKRLDNIISSTVELAQRQARGLLFVGHWGWSYDADIECFQDSEIQSVLQTFGLSFLDRHAE